MNITEVAKKAKVSTATVSRTINKSGPVSLNTQERVWRVVRSTGYHPNTHARALVSGKSRLIGLIISDITNPFFPELVKSFEELALHGGFEVIVANTGYDPERMSQCVRRMLERKADGVAIIMSEMEEGLAAQLEKRQIPIVFSTPARSEGESATSKSTTKWVSARRWSTYSTWDTSGLALLVAPSNCVQSKHDVPSS